VRSLAFSSLSPFRFTSFPIDPIKNCWEKVLESPVTLHQSVGVGDVLRIETNQIIGSSLIYGGITMHLSCLPAIDPLFQRYSTRLNRSSIRERQRSLRSTIGD
jgi:hypothetical protein